MSYQLTVSEKPGYPHFTVTGANTVANVTGYLAGRLKAVAYVDTNAQGGLMKFAETVANNRGMPMNVFETVAEAEAWLAARVRT